MLDDVYAEWALGTALRDLPLQRGVVRAPGVVYLDKVGRSLFRVLELRDHGLSQGGDSAPKSSGEDELEEDLDVEFVLRLGELRADTKELELQDSLQIVLVRREALGDDLVEGFEYEVDEGAWRWALCRHLPLLLELPRLRVEVDVAPQEVTEFGCVDQLLVYLGLGSVDPGPGTQILHHLLLLPVHRSEGLEGEEGLELGAAENHIAVQRTHEGLLLVNLGVGVGGQELLNGYVDLVQHCLDLEVAVVGGQLELEHQPVKLVQAEDHLLFSLQGHFYKNFGVGGDSLQNVDHDEGVVG
mmetsp:Transcript_3345/g.5579  ORF Transcript_3345/g.5579 Transcript_3345/m.5579 type:complete len:299 (+) Transcript_3345:1489-2385(+)